MIRWLALLPPPAPPALPVVEFASAGYAAGEAAGTGERVAGAAA